MAKVVRTSDGVILVELQGEYRVDGNKVYDTDDDGNERLRIAGINGEFTIEA